MAEFRQVQLMVTGIEKSRQQYKNKSRRLMGNQLFPNIKIINDDLSHGIFFLISLCSQDIGGEWGPLFWTLRQLSRGGIV
jgi:hypothetical protein